MGVLLCLGVYWCIGAVRLEQGGIRMQVGAMSSDYYRVFSGGKVAGAWR